MSDPIVTYLEQHLDEYVTDLRHLSSIDSGTDDKAGVDAVQDWLMDRLRRLGFSVWAKSHSGMKREEFDRLIDAELRARDVEIVALAGYMRLLSNEFVGAWEGRILNIHPSLLPAHKGLDTHRRAIEAGDAFAGCSVHIVTPALDDGPVLAQARVRIRPGETPERLAERVLVEEHKLYPQALEDYCRSILAARTTSDSADA